MSGYVLDDLVLAGHIYTNITLIYYGHIHTNITLIYYYAHLHSNKLLCV